MFQVTMDVVYSYPYSVGDHVWAYIAAWDGMECHQCPLNSGVLDPARLLRLPQRTHESSGNNLMGEILGGRRISL